MIARVGCVYISILFYGEHFVYCTRKKPKVIEASRICMDNIMMDTLDNLDLDIFRGCITSKNLYAGKEK